MKKRVLPIVIVLSLSFASGVIVGSSSHRDSAMGTKSTPAQALDPAFRDGLYQAKLDVREGRRPHLAIARWSSEAARNSYVAGYQQGYRESAGSLSGFLSDDSVAQFAASGFRDGMLDGAWHRMASQPYQADQTPHFRDAGLSGINSATDSEVIKNFYREAYVHGYQQAYYSSAK